MRYRHLRVQYTIVGTSGPTWPFAEAWPSDRVRLAVQTSWRPDADVYETPTAVEITVELAGVDEDDLEIQLFDNVVVVEGRRLAAAPPEAVYHAAGIRQGAFRLAVPLPARVDSDGVEAHYDRGLLRVKLPKLRGLQ
jgi:HSP20 family protein